MRLTPADGDLVTVIERCCRETPGPLALVLLPGVVPEGLQPFTLLSEVVDEGFALRITDGWPSVSWRGECERLFSERLLSFSIDQLRRTREQRLEDGRLEVLFVERGRLLGSALTLVATPPLDGRPPPLNARIAAMDLLVAARDCGLVGMDSLVREAREALGLPAGPLSTVSQVRRERAASPTPKQRGGEVIIPTTVPAAPPVRPPPRPARPEDRHAIESGRCLRCGRAGASLEEACGQPSLGRMGMIELD